MRASLILDDGSRFEGRLFGYPAAVSGEVVFNTAMTGYPESLTDPSYAGQILVSTFPLIGNYGVPPHGEGADKLEENFEGGHIYVRGLVVADYSAQYSHWDAQESLEEWLRREKIPALTGIDTRSLTKLIRERGVMKGRIEIEGQVSEDADFDYGQVNFVTEVSCTEPRTYRPAQASPDEKLLRVVVVDCGCKFNIIRSLLRRGVEVVRVPWDYDFNTMDYDALLLSNGPGNPELCTPAVEHIRKAIASERVRPIMGICLGHQLLAIAAGAKVYKLKYGHRGFNQPVKMQGSDRCFITSQNHGYAVDGSTLPKGWKSLLENLNDGSNEGIAHESKPWFSTQFHPEASGGPLDTQVLFDCFVRLAREGASSLYDVLPETQKAEIPSVPRKVLVLGSGALKIGEAGEFDYSGSQAIKALKEEGVQTILINPNIATVQTGEGVADKVYFLPVNPFFVEKIIDRERPDGILLSFGGQTALNCGIALHRSGVLKKYGVRVLGTPVQTIIDTEDRELLSLIHI